MPEPDTTPISSLIARHFDTRYGQRDDAAHLETYAPEAFLVVGERGVRKDQVAPEAVLSAWAEAPRERAPQFLAPSLTAWHPDMDARGVAEVDLREVSTGTALQAALGLVREGEDWRIAWATLMDGPVKPYDTQRVVALSELAGVRAMRLQGPLTSLFEVGYARRHWLPKQRLLALPETHFSCQGTGSCCSHELTIGLDDNSVAFLSAIDWPTQVPGLSEGPYSEPMPAGANALVDFGHRLTREASGRCRFLSADNRCQVHALAGRAVFKPCHVFPYRFTWTPDGICVTTHSMCPTARFAKGAPLASQEADLRSRLAVADVLKAEIYYLKIGQEVTWDVFKTIEGQLLELLSGEAPIKQKLWVATRWLERRLRDPDAGVEPGWYQEAIPKLGWLSRLGFQRFGALFDPCFRDLRGVPAGEGLLPEHEAELTRFFRALLFSKVTTYPYGLVAGLNYAVLVHHVLERQVARHGSRGLSEAFWREFYAVVTSGTFMRVLEVCHRNPATMFSRHAGSPQLGLNLLKLSG